MKRKVILDFIRRLPCREFLEVGCGGGDLLALLERLGYRGIGIDISPEAITVARGRVKGGAVTAEEKRVEEIGDVFDLAIASEVLEHCADDVGFLRELRRHVRPGGWVILTVPAHMDRWGANDEFSGHLRRYERKELWGTMLHAGLEPVCIYSYGVPIYNLLKPLYDRAIGRRIVREDSPADRTAKSSGMWLMTGLKGVFPVIFNGFTMSPFYLMQKLFYRTDLGNGFFAAARRAPEKG